MIFTATELSVTVKNAPDWWGADKESKHNAIFVIPPATVDEVFEAVGEIKPEYEKISNHGNVIFLVCSTENFFQNTVGKDCRKGCL